MEPVYQVGQKVAVNIGGCVGNRTEGVIASIKRRPELITYEVHFPEFGHDSGIEQFYMAELLTPLA
jgi:hypothetical protein